MNLKTELTRFISEELLSGQQLDGNDDLLVDGMVDSIGMMRLMVFIEESIGVNVPPEDFTIENFGTTNAMCEYLLNRVKLNPSSQQKND